MAKTPILGPLGPTARLTRPPREVNTATDDTWYGDCTSPTSQDGTEIRAQPMNDLLAQMRALIDATGTTRNPDDDFMMAKAIQSGKLNYAVAGGTANALTVTLNPAPTSLVDGMRILVQISASSTSTVPMLNVNGLGAKPIVNPDGSALTVGALVAGAKQLVCYDAAKDKFMLLTAANTGVLYGNNWIRHSDGTYEAWGTVLFPAYNRQQDVTLPITFPTSIDTVLVTDRGDGVFPGAARVLTNSTIRVWTGQYILDQASGTIAAKNTVIELFYRAWGR